MGMVQRVPGIRVGVSDLDLAIRDDRASLRRGPLLG